MMRKNIAHINHRDLTSSLSGFAQKKHNMAGDPGFFLDDWKPKRFKGSKSTKNEVKQPESSTVKVDINFADTITKVSPYIFGNNTGIWMGREVMGNEEFIFRLKDADISVYRYPGGNLANDFFWDAASKGQLPPGVPDSICKNIFTGQTREPKQGKMGTWAFDPESYYELLMRNKSARVYLCQTTHMHCIVQSLMKKNVCHKQHIMQQNGCETPISRKN